MKLYRSVAVPLTALAVMIGYAGMTAAPAEAWEVRRLVSPVAKPGYSYEPDEHVYYKDVIVPDDESGPGPNENLRALFEGRDVAIQQQSRGFYAGGQGQVVQIVPQSQLDRAMGGNQTPYVD